MISSNETASGRVIKAHSKSSPSPSETFNFVDLQRQSDDVIAAARRESDGILADARNQAEKIRHQAIIAGRDEGLQDANQSLNQRAREIAEQITTKQLLTALPALRAAAESLQAERDRWVIRWEQTAVGLGVAIAEKLLQRQLISRPDFATEMINSALRLAAGQPELTVYLHPDDLAAWGDRAPQIVQSLTACADTTLVPDESSIRGGCRIETHHGEIDARVETMLRRIADELVDAE